VLLIPPAELPPADALAERFAGLCDRAAAHGTAIALEPVVVLPGFDHVAAHDLIRAVDRPGVGLMFAAWHVFRDPSALSVVKAVAARHVAGLELTDGPAAPRVDLLSDCVNDRLLPGEGDFDLAGLVTRCGRPAPRCRSLSKCCPSCCAGSGRWRTRSARWRRPRRCWRGCDIGSRAACRGSPPSPTSWLRWTSRPQGASSTATPG
jgi:hypothetical protein